MDETDKLIVLEAFVKTDEGELVPAFQPCELDTEERAVNAARLMASHYDGVMAWSRDAESALGNFAQTTILFRAGKTPES